jgi:hypothetical protein
VSVKQGVALARNNRREDALSVWEGILSEKTTNIDLCVKAFAEFHLGCEIISSSPLRAYELLESAFKSNHLDSISNSQAAIELAILSQNSTRLQYEWLRRSFDVKHSIKSNEKEEFVCDSNWNVVSISLVERDGVDEGIIISRFDGENNNLIVKHLTGENYTNIRNQFSSIISRSDETTRRQVASSQGNQKKNFEKKFNKIQDL